MIRPIREFLDRRVDPAPNPLRITVADLDDQLAALRAEPGWDRDPALRLQADRLLDVRAVLARHEEEDRGNAAARPEPAAAGAPVPHQPSIHRVSTP